MPQLEAQGFFFPQTNCTVLQGQRTKFKKPVFYFWIATDLLADLGKVTSSLYVSVSQSEK